MTKRDSRIIVEERHYVHILDSYNRGTSVSVPIGEVEDLIDVLIDVIAKEGK